MSVAHYPAFGRSSREWLPYRNGFGKRLWVRGMVGDPDLSIDEQVQFRVLLLQNMFLWERIYQMEKTLAE